MPGLVVLEVELELVLVVPTPPWLELVDEDPVGPVVPLVVPVVPVVVWARTKHGLPAKKRHVPNASAINRLLFMIRASANRKRVSVIINLSALANPLHQQFHDFIIGDLPRDCNV